MATKKTTGKALAPSGGKSVTTTKGFRADAGRGLEGATQEAFAVPFLIVLQKGSPQVDEASPEMIKGAKAGMFFESVSKKFHDGKKGIIFIPCAYRWVFLRWGPRGTDNAGFKGELKPADVEEMRAKGEIKEGDRGRLYVPLENGTINEKKCDRVSDTRNHYGLLVDPEAEEYIRILLLVSSTQIKKSRNMNTALDNIRAQDEEGRYKPPTFSQKVKLTTVAEANDLGSWFGIDYALAGGLDPDNEFEAGLYAAGRAFNQTVSKGQVVANYDQAGEGGATEDRKGF